MPRNSGEFGNELESSGRKKRSKSRRSYESAEEHGRRAVRELFQDWGEATKED